MKYMKDIRYINSGDFSDVYSIGNGKVLKAFKFRKFTHITCVEDIKSVVKAYWQAEVTAYGTISSLESLSDLFPKFHGTADPHEILNEIDNFREIYVKNCGIIIDLLEGDCIKCSLLCPPISTKVDVVLERISEILKNINVYDSSVFITNDGSFKIFDFGQWANSDYEAELHDRGGLTEDMKLRYLPS